MLLYYKGGFHNTQYNLHTYIHTYVHELLIYKVMDIVAARYFVIYDLLLENFVCIPINLQLCNYRYAYVITSRFYTTGTVVEKDSLIIVVKDAPITAKPKFSVYEPLFETPSVDPVTKTMITGICGGNSECAYDIAVTGNFDVGRETLKDIKEHMIILNQTLPSLYCIMLLYYVVVSVLPYMQKF